MTDVASEMMSGIRKKIIRGLAGCLFGWAAMNTALQAVEVENSGHDVLVYKDGDRVRGKLMDRTSTTIVFQSERFGKLRVPATDAVVIMAAKSQESAEVKARAATPAPEVKPEPRTDAQAARAEEEKLSIWEWFSPSVLTARVRNYFGPWHGRFAFSTEVVSDNTSDRSNTSVEARLQRKWKKDEVSMTGRFDYSNTNQVTTTDVVKADGSWRHDFTKNRFSQYRPTLEWNRANRVRGLPSDYVLLQQEIGVGVNVFSRPTRKLRVGVSANLFDVWTLGANASHSSRTGESAFFETELALPWRMALLQRGVWYYPFRPDQYGWENRMELNKKLTETLSVAIRHEIRRDNPDERVTDYTRLRLMLGLDF